MGENTSAVSRVELVAVPLVFPAGAQVICGQGHFHLLSIEDLFRAIAIGAPGARFGIAFSEASGQRLIRRTGNDDVLIQGAVDNLSALGAGHVFLILMTGAFPIQVLGNIRSLPTFVALYCATGNPSTAVVAKMSSGSAIVGIADGAGPLGTETEQDIKARRSAIRRLGYLESGG